MQVFRARKSKGQVSVLIIFSLIPLFTLLAFTVNVGMLVNAKISLQNAADLAAYAGAATQARQMTHISHLNYQMRQAYKKFLYKYYVLGNLSLRCFPRGGGPLPAGCLEKPGPMIWENPFPNGNTCSNPPCYPGVPSVCISLSTESNICQLAQPVPVVKAPPCIPLDPTCQALTNAATTIAAIQQKSCDASSAINQEVLTHWLYATSDEVQISTNTNLQGLINDVGIITEEIILKNRIATVLDYVNQPARKSVTQANARALEEIPDQAKAERTILAFKTMMGNLNPEVFEAETVEMSELIPSGDPPLLSLKKIDVPFDTAFSMFQKAPNGQDCEQSLEFMSAKPTVGFVKEPTSYVYYAVKVKGQAQLLFNPFPFGATPDDRIELTAYAAAAPFGSRIGPDLDPSNFVKKGTPAKNSINKAEISYPHLPITDVLGWDDVSVLSAYSKALKSSGANQNVGTGAVGQKDLERGLHLAQLPDEVEIGKYNMPVDIPEAEREIIAVDEPKVFVPYFQRGNDEYTFWAPIQKIGGADEFQQQVNAELDLIIDTVGNFNTGQGQVKITKQALKEILQQELGKFLVKLRGKNSFNVAHMADPLSQAFFIKDKASGGTQTPIPGKKTEPRALASSYTTERDDYYLDHGRDGYSVKLIPFRHLFGTNAKLTNVGSSTSIPASTDNFQGERSELVKIPH